MFTAVVEKDETGRTLYTNLSSDGKISNRSYSESVKLERQNKPVLKVLRTIFLPAGYPQSVSADYLHYQIFNSLQAFCSSLAGLIASRATLEGFGVGDSSASATDALLLTVLQDVFSRLTTILGAYYIGTSLFPEAKTYRLLADILNDAAIVLDALSPLLKSVSLPFHIPILLPGSASGFRIAALCLSGSLRALCGVAAGGSKAALTIHFATPGIGTGDVGDLNAKDSSKETVLGLTGMLLGSFIVPYLTTKQSTYSVLFILVAAHLATNYIAVRGVILRSLNKQRTGITWATYRHSHGPSDDLQALAAVQGELPERSIPCPMEVSVRERIFEWPGALRDIATGQYIGRCHMGSSFSSLMPNTASCRDLMRIFADERYILCFAPLSRSQGPRIRPLLQSHICFKENHSPLDQLKAWLHAHEAGMMWMRFSPPPNDDDYVTIIDRSHRVVDKLFPIFLTGLRAAGWNSDEILLMTGPPKAVLLSVMETQTVIDGDEKKRA